MMRSHFVHSLFAKWTNYLLTLKQTFKSSKIHYKNFSSLKMSKVKKNQVNIEGLKWTEYKDFIRLKL